MRVNGTVTLTRGADKIATEVKIMPEMNLHFQNKNMKEKRKDPQFQAENKVKLGESAHSATISRTLNV